MGYTQYWYRDREFSEQSWAQLLTYIRGLIETSDILAMDYAQPDSGPVLTEDCIQFNGKGDKGCETFVFERVMVPRSWEHPEKDGKYFACCKTRAYPYDTYVRIVLDHANVLLGNAIEISHD